MKPTPAMYKVKSMFYTPAIYKKTVNVDSSALDENPRPRKKINRDMWKKSIDMSASILGENSFIVKTSMKSSTSTSMPC